MKSLRFFLITFILCIGAAILVVGLSTADLFSKSALDNPEKQVALAFSPSHEGLSFTIFNDSYEVKYPAFLKAFFSAVSVFFAFLWKGAARLIHLISDGANLAGHIYSFLNYLRDRIV